MSETVTVRRATEADVEALAQIHVAGYEEAYRGLLPDEVIDVRTVDVRRRSWTERLGAGRPRDLVLVAELDGEVAGFVSGRPAEPAESEGLNGNIACWENLYVRPSLIGTGAASEIGTALEGELVPGLREFGFEEAVAFVIEGNERGLRFLQRLGWQLDGARREVEGVAQNRTRRPVATATG